MQKQSRGESLLDKHQSNKAAKKDKEEPPMIWDHARDMGVTGRLLNNEERQAKIRYVALLPPALPSKLCFTAMPPSAFDPGFVLHVQMTSPFIASI